MTKDQHPLSAKLDKGVKILVWMPNRTLRWRMPKWRNGGWFVRDSYGWRELSLGRGGTSYEAGTF